MALIVRMILYFTAPTLMLAAGRVKRVSGTRKKARNMATPTVTAITP
jgi:hypothetical protein